MALINCTECGKPVSDKASSCPNCGNPIAKTSINQPISKPISDEKLLYCPKCNSSQLSTNKKGFSGGKALTGAVLTGGIGLLAGTIGSNKVILTCLKCGFKFDAGEYEKKKWEFESKRQQTNAQNKEYKNKIKQVVEGKISLLSFLSPYITANFIVLISIILSFIFNLNVLGYALIIILLIAILLTNSVINDVNKQKKKNDKV